MCSSRLPCTAGDFEEDTSGQQEPCGDAICSHLVPISVPTEAGIGPARALSRAVCGEVGEPGHAERGAAEGAVASNGLSNRPRIPDGLDQTGGNHHPRVRGSSPSSAIKAKPSTRVLALEHRDAPPQLLPVIDAIKQLCSSGRSETNPRWPGMLLNVWNRRHSLLWKVLLRRPRPRRPTRRRRACLRPRRNTRGSELGRAH